MLIICIKRHVPTASDQLWSVKRGGDGTLPGGYCSRGCDGRGERFITLVLSGQLVRENRFLRRRVPCRKFCVTSSNLKSRLCGKI